MKFCPECGTNIEGMKFCVNCGKMNDNVDNLTEKHPIQSINEEVTILEFSTYMFGLEGKRKGVVSVPTENYKLTNQRIMIVKQGLITKKHDEIELYKIKDIEVKQKLKDKVVNIGDILIISSDESTPTFLLKRIKNPIEVKEAIRSASRNAKKEVGVSYRQDI